MAMTVVVETKSTRLQFGDDSITGIMVYLITRRVIVSPRQKATRKMRLSINNSTEAIKIVTIVMRITMPDGVGQTVK